MRAQSVLIPLVALVLVAGGCGGNPSGTPDGGVVDSGTDAGTDAGDTDAGSDGGDTDAGTDGGDTDAGTDGGDTDAGTDGGGVVVELSCQGTIYLCGNTLDDDGDGLVDMDDPDCLGPCDNNEGGFATEIPGGTSTCNGGVDCYFDGNSGSGNDTCEAFLFCDDLNPEPDCGVDTGNTKCGGEPIGPLCLDVCGPLTPNGCDCFGCCDLSSDPDFPDYRFIGTGAIPKSPTCTLDNIEGCNACTPVLDCLEECGRCQICLNKTVDDLPDDCPNSPNYDPGDPDGGTDGGDVDAGDPGDVQCPGGEQPCGLPGQDACVSGYFCLTGCCRPIPG